MYLAPLFSENIKAYYIIQDSFGIILLLTIILYWHWQKLNIYELKELVVKPPIKKEGLLLWIILGLLYISIPILAAALFHDEAVTYVPILSRVDSISEIIITIIITCIIGPFVEEIYYRGLFYNYLRTKVGVKLGVFLIAVLFACVHGFSIVFIGIFVLGLIYGYLFEKTESVLVPFLFHFYNNLIILALSVYNGYIFKHFTLVYYVYFMAFTIGLMYTIYLTFFSKKVNSFRDGAA
jgi:membrane protease YdiL (CAAX protease family)